ncbi:hypothetical protein QH639_20960 [Lysinibacillus sp. 1 U-2021]|uniref:hypothetical protein n=1 Tax=Lysinibacillus sp. 1 U-2021 TaxID=3039426 RepID=UPI00248077B3|nr:hypothetical protein [Lysinibacillus sp. 1 U-2021]WGT38259.1 hypothetical protein QH639_20960 [Lysinibacillus sp. 1 U-2021]
MQNHLRGSFSAINEYVSDNQEGVLDTRVVVLKNDKSLLDDIFRVAITRSSNEYKVSIHWEDNGIENYKALGLYGVYWASYVDMEYTSGCLEIYSDNLTIQIY